MDIKALIYAVAQVVFTICLAVSVYELFQFLKGAYKNLFKRS